MDDHEQYLLLLLSDSNLPTGAFVASSGLESYAKHGFVTPVPSLGYEASLANFVQDSLESYGRTTLPFVADAHEAVKELSLAYSDAKSTPGTVKEERGEVLVGEEGKETMAAVEQTLRTLVALDELYQTMTLNHVSRRASMSQGVALLNLFSKGFSRPAFVSQVQPTPGPVGLGDTRASHDSHQQGLRTLVDKFKLLVRKECTFGHLPVCWGVLTAALGLSLERAQYLHLFLHARSLLSASVRLNDIGPYNAQQLLLHVVRPLVSQNVDRCRDLRSGVRHDQADFDEVKQGPANTWPLGEILAGRHDLQHSRIFNS